jgi:hypothetical protein
MSESNAGVVSRVPWARATLRLPAAPVVLPLWEVAAIALLTPLLLSLAIWNGFPFTFYDTGAYILQGFANFFVPERAAAYSYFLRFAGAQNSLWWVAATQTAIVAFVMVEFVRTEAPQTSLWRLLGIGAFLCLFTSIGWVSPEIEPDCFTAVVVLTAWLLGFRARQLGWLRSILLIAASGLAIASHPSHLGLAAGLVLLMASYAAVSYNRAALLRANPLLPLVSFALGIGLVLTANYALTKHVFLTRSGPVFMTARMIEDGVAKRVLDDTCP